LAAVAFYFSLLELKILYMYWFVCVQFQHRCRKYWPSCTLYQWLSEEIRKLYS